MIEAKYGLPYPDGAFLLISGGPFAVKESPAGLRARLEQAIARAAEERPVSTEAVRALLRRGSYKPSGRGKPASEYLLQAAREGRFPFINNLVDINNLLSLESGLPISLLDREALTERVELRLGASGESYVFNQAGQSIDLTDLLSVCALGDDGASVPLGNAVKDSLKAKLKDSSAYALGCVYAPLSACGLLPDLYGRFSSLLAEYCGAGNSTCKGAILTQGDLMRL
jgi:hypothetical protein